MIIKFAIKSGIALTAVYFTKHQNVWGDSVATAKLYDNICTEITPHCKSLKKKIPIEMPLLPSSGEIRFLAHHYYNNGVKNTIHFIHMFPCYIGRWAKKGKDAITKVLDNPSSQITTPTSSTQSAK